MPPGDWALHKPYLDAARSRLGERAWKEALAEGMSMSLEEAVEYALAEEEEPSADQPPVGLTHREKEVALLVRRGLTNRQISTKLGISERTAGNHVARILSKQGLHSRAQIAAWATERHLLTPDPD